MHGYREYIMYSVPVLVLGGSSITDLRTRMKAVIVQDTAVARMKTTKHGGGRVYITGPLPVRRLIESVNDLHF